jgi:hypothetical protein
MIRLSFLVAYLVLLVTAQVPSSTDWRGLSPLNSTRIDVERTLGPADQKLDNGQMTYYFPDVVVFFHFTSNPKCRQKLPYTSWNVTSDTVTGIDVSLRHPPLVAETGIDLTKFKRIKGDYDLVDRYHYLNTDDTFGIEVGGNHVVGYHYRPGVTHKDLRCEPSDQRQR